MINRPVEVLLVEQSASLAKRISESLSYGQTIESLSYGQTMQFKVNWVQEIKSAMELMNKAHVDVLLLDLSITSAESGLVVKHLLSQAPNTIVILLCNQLDKFIALQAMAQGAHDCIDKNSLGRNLIKRVLRYNIMLARTEKLLAISQATLLAVGDTLPLGIIIADIHGKITYTNHTYQLITGFSLRQSLDQPWIDQIHPDDRLRMAKEWREALQSQQTFHSKVRINRQVDNNCSVFMTGRFIKDGKQLYGHVRTIEKHIIPNTGLAPILSVAQDKLSSMPTSTAQLTLDVMKDAVLSINNDDKIIYLNHAAELLTGWTSHDAMGHVLAEVFNVKSSETDNLDEHEEEVLATENFSDIAKDRILVRKDGVETIIAKTKSPITDKGGKCQGSVFVFHDVTQSREMTSKITHMAEHDNLTGLANRMLLHDHLLQALVLAKRHDKQLALLYLDIDLFKQTNDQYGHKVGDKLLCSIAKRMTEAVRKSDTVCRQGGDEFIILLSEIEQPENAAKFARKLLSSLSRPHLIDEKEIVANMSIGISIFPDDNTKSVELIECADSAMFQAKSKGGNCYCFFNDAMQKGVIQ